MSSDEGPLKKRTYAAAVAASCHETAPASTPSTNDSNGAHPLHSSGSDNEHLSSTANSDKRSETMDSEAKTSEKERVTKNMNLLDLETALQRLVDVANTEHDEEKELLSDNSHVVFRKGQASDATAIANLYRQYKQGADNSSSGLIKDDQEGRDDNEHDEQELQIWLADGLGNESTPPALFALIADVHSTVITTQPVNKYAAVALLTLGWEHGQRVLRIEWLHVNPLLAEASILGKRMWLRLSALGLLTACQVVVVDKSAIDSAIET